MIKNLSALAVQKKRALITDKIREFFKTKGFLEVQTPIFVKLPGMEPYLNPLPYEFADEGGKKNKGYVITSPEYSLKKLLAQGFPKLFEITRVFRQNESFGGIHNPEFSMIEWYRPRSNYRKIMSDAKELILFLARSLYKKDWIKYGKEKIDLRTPWPKISVKQAFKKYAGVNLDEAKTLSAFRKQFYLAKASGRGGLNEELPKSYSWDDIFYTVFLNQIEPNFPKNRPVIVYDYPLPQASLAKRKTTPRLPSTTLGINRSGQESFYAERFELYIGGLELANCFSELTDAREQEKRLKQEKTLRKKLGKEVYDIDKDFIAALRSGLPETGGIALGIDRLQMLLLDIQDINNLLLVPAKELFKKTDS